MGTLTTTEIGSVVLGIVENVPAGITGLITTIVSQQVYFAEQMTGNTIGTTAIAEVYQPGIISLSVGNVLGLMSAQGIGTESVKIGELAISKGMNTQSASDWTNLGIKQIEGIGEPVKFYQTYS